MLSGLALLVNGGEPLPDRLPSTFEFIDPVYKGDRFDGQHVVVFGGTSGIGFATAAMFGQECAARVVLVGRNRKKGSLALQVLNERAVRGHCSDPGVFEYQHADITKKEQVRAVVDSFRNKGTGKLHVLVQAAAVTGYIGNYGDLPDEILFTGRDAVYTNLYGTKIVTQEALKFWGKTGCAPLGGQPCAGLDYLPSYVIISSADGMGPCAMCESYGESKHALISMATSIAGSFPGELRVNAILPGLVDTPFTWNQVRNYDLKPDGSLEVDSSMQTGWQCKVDGVFVENGECQDGGTGYGCPCEDVFRDDPRNPAVWGDLWQTIIDPRVIGHAILDMSAASSNSTGVSRVVDNNKKQYQCVESGDLPLWRSCPVVQHLRNSMFLGI